MQPDLADSKPSDTQLRSIFEQMVLNDLLGPAAGPDSSRDGGSL
jgi:hypothetical protein